MAIIETTLHASYQADTWSVLQAVREIISNAIDGETRYAHLGSGKMDLDYSARAKTLTVRNDGVTVPTKALLMGTSESREDERAIGQFGEGLPMALLVLARCGTSVEIDNGAERWVPTIERSANFGGEPVLVVNTRKLPKDRDAFEVRIGGIDKDTWDQIRGLFLRFDTDFDPAQTVTAAGDSQAENPGIEAVLLQPAYTGRIYNKGVLVTVRDDLLYGYDLRQDLNRDRSMMNEWDLRDGLGYLLRRAVSSDPTRFMGPLLDVAFAASNERALELADRYSSLYHSEGFREAAWERFASEHGKLAFPVESDDEEKRARSIGRTPVRMSPLLSRVLIAKTGSLDELARSAAESIERLWLLYELSTAERYTFEVCKALVTAAQPFVMEGLKVKLVTFRGDVPFAVTDNETTLLVSKEHLLDFDTTLTSFARGVARASGDSRSESATLVDIIGKLVRGEGTMSLALLLLAQESRVVGGVP